jgi:purine-binding chemotaxis protein CheW
MKTGARSNVFTIANATVPSGVVNAPRLRIVTFTLETGRYALPLSAVERVESVVEITSLPKAPEIVLGIVNLQGRIIPVVNVRRRFGHPDREVELSDRLIVARTSRRPVALLVDRVEGLIERAEREIVQAPDVLPGLEYIRGVAKLADGLVLIHDLDTFLSLDEEQRLDEALAPTGT